MVRVMRGVALLLVVACNGAGADKDPDEGSGDETDSEGTEGTEGTEGPQLPSDWTRGPALPDCEPESGEAGRLALSGVVLLPSGPVAGMVVVDEGTGRIECAGDCDPDGATVVCTEGIISPGLIDAHNHMQYNVLGPWPHGKQYGDRYDWQNDGDYWDWREAYDEVWDDGYDCEIGRWAEWRLLLHGTTSAVGTNAPDCVVGWVRNLDSDPEFHGISGYGLEYSSSKVMNFDQGDANDLKDDLGSGRFEAMAHHVAEGWDGNVSEEIDQMDDLGLVGPGQIYVHATDATTAQLDRMASDGTAIVWSPRSNLDLYRTTTPVEVAKRLGVAVALGNDWTWSGSFASTREMSCAWEWLRSRDSTLGDVDIWEMATGDAARVLQIDGSVGLLIAGLKADVAVYRYSDEPYRAVIEAQTDDVLLVMVDGEPLVVAESIGDQLSLGGGGCSTVERCDDSVQLCGFSGSSLRPSSVQSDLTSALASGDAPGFPTGDDLFPIVECGLTRASCDLSEPAEGDQDGDGEPDGDDDCPQGYDPEQLDSDGDGLGDLCDPCPLSAACE